MSKEGIYDHLGNVLQEGDRVCILSIPSSLLLNLPDVDQEAIKEIKGKNLEIMGFDIYGNIELEFENKPQEFHTIWIAGTNLEKVCT